MQDSTDPDVSQRAFAQRSALRALYTSTAKIYPKCENKGQTRAFLAAFSFGFFFGIQGGGSKIVVSQTPHSKRFRIPQLPSLVMVRLALD